MDPASLAAGLFGVVCELYRVSMATYKLYIEIKDFSPAFRDLRLAFNLERERLKLWAECMGIDPGSGLNDRLRSNPDLLTIIQEILTKLKNTFEESAKKLEEYQSAQSPPPAPEAESDEKPDLKRRISPEGAKRVWDNYSRIVKWATHDKKKLETLIEKLKRYNNDLDHLATTAEQASIRRYWRTQFVVNSQLEELRLIQETAQTMGHEDLSREAASKAFVQEVYRQEELCASLEATKLKAVVQSESDLPETLNSWKFDPDKLKYKGIAIMAHLSRSLATYGRLLDDKDVVLVDFSKCRDDSWRRYNKEAFEIRLSNLARVLNRDLLPNGFQVLRCLGYVYASSTTIGYIYQPPSEAVPDKEPVSLHHILHEVKSPYDVPELGTRFALAKAVTTTLYEFHNIGWLHKNIQPANILFWHSKDKNGTLDLSKPYLVGFDLSRSNQPGEISEKPISSEDEDVYRHPDYKGATATGFKPAYDYYSLGIVLFEIAMWHLVSRTSPSKDRSGVRPIQGSVPEARRPSVADPDFVPRTVASKAQDLGRFLGARYREAVLAIINHDFDTVWDSAEDGNRELALQQAFQKKVIDAVDFCQA